MDSLTKWDLRGKELAEICSLYGGRPKLARFIGMSKERLFQISNDYTVMPKYRDGLIQMVGELAYFRELLKIRRRDKIACDDLELWYAELESNELTRIKTKVKADKKNGNHG